MSRKHYIEVAAVIKAQVESHASDSGTDAAVRGCLNEVANGLATMFQADNPNFNWTTFKSACGLI